MERYEEILEFWFEDLDEDSLVTPESELNRKWFAKDSKLDKDIKSKFAGDVKKAAKGEYDSWIEDPRGRLALIIILDQFTRNVYRDTPEAFSNDLKALELALMSAKDEFDGRVYFVERIFYYLPMEHSESLEVQETSVNLFQKLYNEAQRYEDQNAPYLKYVLDYAQRHLEVIKLFGRFPHRNKTLGRRSTSEEIEFLQDPNNWF